MKIRTFRATVLLFALMSGGAFAQELGPIPTTVDIGEKMSAFPPGAQMVEMVRLYNNRITDRISTHGMPDNWEDLGWRVEGTVGFMAFYPWGDAVPLYNCFSNDSSNDYFTSNDANCEGHFLSTWAPIIGWVMPYQIEGTVTLYRCDTPGYAEDHFDTTDVNCEGKPGAINEGLIGWIWM